MAMSDNTVLFFDTTLRDGEQSPGCSMTEPEKLRLAHALDALGVDILEAGFAISSEGDFQAIRRVAREVRRPVIASLARARREDIERAAASIEGAERARIHTFLASSDIHLEYKLKMSREKALAQVGEMVALARSYVEDVEFSAEDATRTDIDYLCAMLRIAIEAGATTINLPDTTGFSTPAEYAAMYRAVREKVLDGTPRAETVILSTHCHDDLGLAVANTMAGIEGGARQVECTINGIGERAGNAALEEIAAVLKVRTAFYKVDTNIVLNKLYATSKLLGETISFKPAPNKAIVGENAFAHEAGIHQHGMLANPLTYEIMTPASVGQPTNKLVLGKHSGRAALRARLAELGFTLDAPQMETAYAEFTTLADRKKSIYDQDLLNLATRATGRESTVGTAVQA
jgi:2-isopropylmalate synthase